MNVKTLTYIPAIFCLLLMCNLSSVAQEDIIITQEMAEELMNRSNIKGPLEFKGHVKELSKKLKGAIVTLYESPDGSHENLVEVLRTTTPGNGEFEFKLEINKYYVLSVEKPGYTTKQIDIDTDVSMAREQYKTVPKFEFEVDMVQDLDGLAFSGPVARVFYQIKQNEFDYELDYSKEEMEDEERELRERQEKERLARLAYEKKKEIEEAAELLRDKENATAQQLIKAAITVGDNDRSKIIKGFEQVFPEVDTLRSKKAAAMYDKLLEERKRTQATGTEIDYMAIFGAAKAVESKVEQKAEEERQAKLTILKQEQEELQRKEAEAMTLQQQALELEAKEKLAAAIAQEELRKAKEEKEKRDAVYYAIFNAKGNSEQAIENLIRTYPKSDPYREQKARAIYSEYEKTRLTGTTLADMDFAKLFAAADVAEQAAIKEEVSEDNQKQNSRLDAFMAKVEERKRQEQQQIALSIEQGLKEAPKDRSSQIDVFKNALPKNETYKDAKAQAMYEEYKKQQEAIAVIEKTIALVPKDKKTQYELFFNALPEDTENRAQTAQKMYDSYVASVVFQKQNDPSAQLKEEKLIMESLPADLPGKEQLAKAIYKAAAGKEDKQSQLNAIINNLPVGIKNKEEVAQQIYDTYVEKKQKQGGTGTVSLDFSSLFGAAETAAANVEEEAKKQRAIEKRKQQEALEAKRQEVREQKAEIAKKVETQVEQVHRQELAKAKTKKERDLAEALEKGAGDRDKTVSEIMKVLPETGDRQLDRDRAEAVFDAYINESNAIKRSGQTGKKIDFAALFAAADRVELEKLEKEFQQKEAQKEVELAKYEEQRTQKAIAMTEAQQKQAEQEIALAEKKYEETLLKTEAMRQERLLAEQKEKEELEKAIAMEKAKREAQEQELASSELSQIEKERQARLERERKEQERLAAIKAENERKAREQQERAAAEQLALLEKQKQEAEEAERKRIEAEKKEQERLALAAAKEEAARKKEEERKRIEEELRQAELAKQQAELAEKKRREQYDRLVSEADAAMAKNNVKLGWEKYKEALAMYPDEKELAAKFKETDRQLKQLEKQQAEQLAIDQQYNQLMQEADQELAQNNYDAAKERLRKASELKPDEPEPKQQMRDIERTLEQLAAEQKEKQLAEREYVITLQEAAKALKANDLALAKEKYQKASRLKPEDNVPKQRLKEIADREADLALQREKELAKQELARQKYKEQQAQAAELVAQEAARAEAERQARIAALEGIKDAKELQKLTAAEQEEARIEAFEKLKQSLEEMDMSAEEQRQAFLSELARIYPQGITKETVQGDNFVLVRHVINENNVVTVYEKKTWDWGGVFYFKNGDIAITQSIYDLEIGKYQE